MISLLHTMFYLWLVITILLIIMWFLRRRDLVSGALDEHVLGRGPGEPQSAGAKRPSRAEQRAERPNRPSEQIGGGPPSGAARRKRATPPDDMTIADDGALADEATGAAKTTDRIEVGRRGEPAIAQTVTEVLEGATLPCGLTPAPARITEPDRHAIFLSSGSDAEVVGTAFADELVRLGFAIEPDGDDQARASRDGQVLMLRISQQAGTRGSGDYRRYPTAGHDDVAIEVWIGQDLPPRLAGD